MMVMILYNTKQCNSCNTIYFNSIYYNLISYNVIEYNDNTNVDLFQYFHESRMARVKMRWKKVDVSIVFIANDVVLLWQRYVDMTSLRAVTQLWTTFDT